MFLSTAPGYVLVPLQDIDTRNGSRVVLQCSANAHPPPVHYVWKKDGVHIANSTDDSLVLTDGLTIRCGRVHLLSL